ncbi:hypothetical protein [Actinomadura hibisca]|uniref:hypothetical protein n=1 Tax=Actinomadura hibisca TaxID=68565 RepID=UPI0008301B26|nr:hypothetical protein [Actinomadura hibisca]
MALCAWCYGPADALLRAGRAGTDHRAALTCTTCRTRARAWTRTAGPITETRLTTAPAPARPAAAQPALF